MKFNLIIMSLFILTWNIYIFRQGLFAFKKKEVSELVLVLNNSTAIFNGYFTYIFVHFLPEYLSITNKSLFLVSTILLVMSLWKCKKVINLKKARAIRKKEQKWGTIPTKTFRFWVIINVFSFISVMLVGFNTLKHY